MITGAATPNQNTMTMFNDLEKAQNFKDQLQMFTKMSKENGKLADDCHATDWHKAKSMLTMSHQQGDAETVGLKLKQRTDLNIRESDDNVSGAISQQIKDMIGGDWASSSQNNDLKDGSTPCTVEKEAAQNALTQLLLDGSQQTQGNEECNESINDKLFLIGVNDNQYKKSVSELSDCLSASDDGNGSDIQRIKAKIWKRPIKS